MLDSRELGSVLLIALLRSVTRQIHDVIGSLIGRYWSVLNTSPLMVAVEL